MSNPIDETPAPEKNKDWSHLVHHEDHYLGVALKGLEPEFSEVQNLGETTLDEFMLEILVVDGVFTFKERGGTYSTGIVLEYMLEHREELQDAKVADVGTGSGVLALAAAKLGALKVYASDINPRAVANAIVNRYYNKFKKEQVEISKASILDAVPEDEKLDIILANIPIVESGLWGKTNISQIAEKLLDDAKLKLKEGGKLLIPWGSFAESGKENLQAMLSNKDYDYKIVKTIDKEGHTWSLYEATLKQKSSNGSEQ